MKIGQLSTGELLRQARAEGFCFTSGPFRIQLRTPLRALVSTFQQLYGELPLEPPRGIRDFHLEVAPVPGIRRWWRPQAYFYLDGQRPFEPYPLAHAFPLFEWGLNYSMALRAHQYCLLHSAVVERQGHALVLPAMPGSGKSTLCAALMLKGWRLLSDEFGIVLPNSGQLLPMPRAIPLKNASIEVIRRFSSQGRLGPLFAGTRKGDVAHLAPTAISLQRQHEEAAPRWILFPRYRQGSATRLRPLARSQAFLRLSNNAFNYHLLGETAFVALTRMVQACQCYSFEYSNLDEAVEVLGALAP